MRTFRWTIKRKLLALAGVTFVLAAGVLAGWSWLEFREHVEIAERELALVSLQGAGQVRGLVDVATRTLEVLAVEAGVERGDVVAMRRAFNAIQAGQPDVDNVIATDADGRLIASGVPLPEDATVSLADRPWFHEVLTTGRRAIGGYQVGRVTGRPGVVVAIPVGRHEGRPKSVLAVALNLEWLHRLFQALPLGRGVTITVLDGERRVLAHFPDAVRRPGDTVRLPASLPAAPAVATVPGVDGSPVMVAAAPVKETGWSVLVSITQASLETDVASDVIPIAALLLLLLTVVYGVGLLMARRIWRPIHALTEAARKLPSNEPHAPLPVESSDDIGDLARAFNAMAAEITRARGELEARVVEATTSDVVGRLLTETLELPAVLERLSEIARTRLDADMVRVWLAADVPGVYTLAAQAGDATTPDGFQMRLGAGEGLVGWIVERLSPLVIDDVAADERLVNLDWIRREGLVSFLGVPVIVADAAVGVLAVMTRRPRRFTASDVALAEAIALPAGIAIHNARLYEEQVRSKAAAARLYEELRLRAGELEQRGQQLALLHDAARTLAGEHDLLSLLQRLVDTAQRLLGCRYAALAALDEPGRIGQFLTAGLSEPERRRIGALPEGRGVLGHVLRHGELVRLDDVSRHPSAVGFPEGHPVLRSILGAPIEVHGRVVGALYLAEAAGGFTAAHETMLTTLCADAAIAIDNARLLAAEQARRVEADTLLRLALLTGATLDEKELFRRIALETARACGADRCSLYVLDPSGTHVVPVMSQFADGTRDLEMWRAFKAKEKLALDALPLFRAAIERTEPLLIATPSDPLIPPGWAELYRIRSLLVVPLLHRDAALGVLTLMLTRDDAAFTPDQVRLATTIAAQVVLSIENARLVKDLRQAVGDLHRVQDQLVQTETLRALGEMAAGVAHHLNNLLTIVLGRTQLLLERTRDRELRRVLQIVERAAKDGADVVRRIHGFSRLQPVSELAPVDLNALARDVIDMTRPRWSDEAVARGVHIEVELDAGTIAPVEGEASALREVLVNLVLNAVDALPAGGRITVRTWQEGGQVACAVTDTGTGMSEEVQRRAFEPFFTTKGPRSTGLGLSVNYGIVRRHGGVLEIDSAVDRGTTVRFRLPAGPGSRRPAPARAPERPPPLRILLVDDEEAVRSTLADILRAQGHDVVAAEGGREAIAILERGETVDLVLTDLGMPEMSGRQLAAAVRQRWPSLLIGVVTGWGERAKADFEVGSVTDFVVDKPPALADLAAAIAAAVARRSRGGDGGRAER
ncbi:MAG: GAF domain-containing protein [Candidatus Rokubacteria bacterium]|nr:GAF domain-containing protein [Candidatus Rokubacteria bacterium]